MNPGHHNLKETGMAMLITLLFMALLTLIAASSLYLGYSQKSFARSSYQEAQALYLAESGIEQVLYWFRYPEIFQIASHFKNGYVGDSKKFFAKRRQDGTTFFDDT